MQDRNDYYLGDLRYAIAALARYLIQAREIVEPGFLGDDDAYSSWQIERGRTRAESVLTLLRLAREAHDKIWRLFLEMGGSGKSFSPNEPYQQFKQDVAFLTEEENLDKAIRAVRAEDDVDWLSLAEWNRLPDIRRFLDSLPHPKQPKLRDESGGSEDGPYLPDGFFYRGERYRMPAKECRLVAELWVARDHTVVFEDLAGPVWGDYAKPITKGMVRSARTRANKFFKENGLPFRVKIVDGHARLTG